MILTIKNVYDDNFIKAIKSLAKAFNAQIKIQDDNKDTSLKRAMKDMKEGEFEVFDDFKSYKQAMKNV
jgi:hypothetical protein